MTPEARTAFLDAYEALCYVHGCFVDWGMDPKTDAVLLYLNDDLHELDDHRKALEATV